MAKSKRSGKGNELAYTKYKNSGNCERNRKRRVARHLREHPNDKQATTAFGKTYNYRRKAPGEHRGHVDRNSPGALVNLEIAKMPDEHGRPLLSVKEQRAYNEQVAGIRRARNIKLLTRGEEETFSKEYQNIQKKFEFQKEHDESIRRQKQREHLEARELPKRVKKEKEVISRKKTKQAV